MSEAETADAIGRSIVALWLSGGALAVAVLAAGFTFWQALTAHLERVAAARARWVFSYRDLDFPSRAGGSGWHLENVGKTTATDVKLVARSSRRSLELAPARPRTWTYAAAAPVPPGNTARLLGSELTPDPTKWWIAGESDGWMVAEVDKWGKPKSLAAFRGLEQMAIVTWSDERGRARRATLPLY